MLKQILIIEIGRNTVCTPVAWCIAFVSRVVVVVVVVVARSRA